MSVYFENLRELVPLRVNTGQAIHAIVDPLTRRVASFTNFSLVPRLIKENLPDFQFDIQYNVQKILLTSGGEVFRPRMKAREYTPWAFGIHDGAIYDADGVPLSQEHIDKYQMVASQTAAADLLIRVVNAKRREFNNVSIFGQDRIYALKAREAVRVINFDIAGKEIPIEKVPFVHAYAELAGIPLLEAANKIVAKNLEERNHLIDSEDERMIMSKKIFTTSSYEELKELMQEFADKNEGFF